MPFDLRSPRPTWEKTWLGVADVVARRSLCSRSQVGAVIVDPRNRIVATGYNGPPAGFSPTGGRGNDELLALGCAHWCVRAQRGVDPTRFQPDPTIAAGSRAIVKTPLGVPRFESPLSPDYSDCPSLHAEANALSVCERRVREGGTIYITGDVCFGCAKLVANSGLAEVVVRSDGAAHRMPEQSYGFLEACGLTVIIITPQEWEKK